MAKTHGHWVSFDEAEMCVRVYRIMPGRERVLYLELDIPRDPKEGWRFTEVARILGEDILMDSPYAQYLFAVCA